MEMDELLETAMKAVDRIVAQTGSFQRMSFVMWLVELSVKTGRPVEEIFEMFKNAVRMVSKDG